MMLSSTVAITTAVILTHAQIMSVVVGRVGGWSLSKFSNKCAPKYQS